MCFARFFSVIFIFCLITDFVSGQETKKILLKSATELEFNRPVNPDVQVLRGNVVFQHGESFLYCDSAYLYINRNAMDAFGDVHIKVSDTTQIYGEKLHYDGNRSIAVMERDVQLIDRNIILTTDRLTYDLANGVGYYLNGAEIQDPSNKLVSKHGYYYSGKKEFFFRHDVVVTGNNFRLTSDSLMYNTITEFIYFYGQTHIESDSTDIYCNAGWYNTLTDQTELTGRAKMINKTSVLEADTLFYDRKTGTGNAFSNVVFRDTTEKLMLLAQIARYREADSSILATDSAVFITWEENDSLYLHGDTLFSRRDTLLGREIMVYHGVRFYRNDLQGVCDSLYYCESDSLMKMFVNPCLWSDSTQMSADYIDFLVYRSEMRRLFMKGNAFIASHFEDEDYQQVKGNVMHGYFVANDLNNMLVQGNAESIYFIADDKGVRTGINKSNSAALNMFFENSEVTDILMKGSPTGVIYPENELLPEQRRLSGFFWRGHLRPMGPNDVVKPVSDPNVPSVIRGNAGGGDE